MNWSAIDYLLGEDASREAGLVEDFHGAAEALFVISDDLCSGTLVEDWASCCNEVEKIISRLTIPRVVIDNGVCPNSTVVKVDSDRKDGILLEAVQVLTDLNLCINKAYISSDGRWFMDDRVVSLDMDQGIALLRASLMSKAVLTDVFLRR